MNELNELSNMDILNILGKKNIRINGVFSKDLIPKLKKGFYVINIQNSNDGNGSHWTCLLCDDENFYFDSFGSPSPVEIQNNLKEYFFNDKQIQNTNSSACGWFCIAFIIFMSKTKKTENDFNNFLNIFKTNTKYNDKILKSLLM